MTNDNPGGNNKIYGLLGKNISYSLSPLLHNTAFAHFDIPAEYKLFDIPEDKIDSFIEQEVYAGRINGFNVTVPYKIKMRDMFLGQSNENDWVKIIGAINTVKVDSGSISTYNTDTQGFYESLSEDAEFDPGLTEEIFIFGAGGAGRAISLYMAMTTAPITIHGLPPASTATGSVLAPFTAARYPSVSAAPAAATMLDSMAPTIAITSM